MKILKRTYPDIFCERCGKQTPRQSTAQKYCFECGEIVAKARTKKWRKDNKEKIKQYSLARKSVKVGDSIDHYRKATNWSYFQDGKCKNCNKETGLNRFFLCKACHSYISTHDMSSPDDPYFAEGGPMSKMPYTRLL